MPGESDWLRPEISHKTLENQASSFGRPFPCPGQSLVEPVVSPEHFAVRRAEARRTEYPERLRFFRVGAQLRLDRNVRAEPPEVVRFETRARQAIRQHSVIGNVQTLAEGSAIDRTGECGVRALA